MLAIGLAAAAMLAAGCGGGVPRVARERLDLVSVSGAVTLDGAPLPDAEVRLVADDGTFAVGRSDTEGRFEMWFDTTTPGVTRGWKRVLVLPGSAGGEDGDPADAPSGPQSYRLESADRVEIDGPSAALGIRVTSAAR